MKNATLLGYILYHRYNYNTTEYSSLLVTACNLLLLVESTRTLNYYRSEFSSHHAKVWDMGTPDIQGIWIISLIGEASFVHPTYFAYSYSHRIRTNNNKKYDVMCVHYTCILLFLFFKSFVPFFISYLWLKHLSKHELLKWSP